MAAVLSAGERLPQEVHQSGPSDVLYLADRELSPVTQRHYEQIRRVVQPPRKSGHDEQALLLSILAAFPDRVARRRAGNDLLLAAGGSAKLTAQSVVRDAPFLVAVDIEES